MKEVILDEAIKMYINNAEYERTHGNLQGCLDFRQLAEWLSELKCYKERIPSYETGYNDAKREIALSGEYERAYERGKADAQPKWTPVSKKLPEEFAYVFCSTDAKEVFLASYLGKMNDGEDCFDDYEGMMWKGDVIAWMPLPEPYKAKGRPCVGRYKIH